MLRAVPAIMLVAASMLPALRSGILSSAILRTSSREMVATLTLLGWPEPDWIIRPYVGVGVEYVDASFEHANWWHYGWSSPEDYARNGHGSTKPHHGVTRTMVVKKPGCAPTLSGGVTIGVSRHVQLDAYVRWTDFDDAETVFRRRDPIHSHEYTMRTGAFPAEHIVYGIALKAVF